MSARAGKTLILAGHGSQSPTSVFTTNRAAQELTMTLASQDAFDAQPFDAVAVGFIRAKPKLSDTASILSGQPAVVVPMTVCEGLVTTALIPAAIGDASNVTIARPVGDHPTLIAAWAKRIQGVIADNDLSAETTTVLVIGHGTMKAPASKEATDAVAAQLNACGVSVPSQVLLLEEAPLLGEWRDVCQSPNVIAAPFFLAGGLHGGQDIPEAFGFDPVDPPVAALDQTAGAIGPYTVENRQVYLVSAMGLEPELTDCILDRAHEALAAL